MKKDSKFRNSVFYRTLMIFFGRGLLSKICFSLLIIFALIALFAPLIATHNPTDIAISDAYASLSEEHLLGADRLGRDVFSRLVYGSRISLFISFLASMIAALIGLLLGLTAGYFEGIWGQFIMRLTDAELSIPPLVLTLVLSVLVNEGIVGVAFVIGVAIAPTYIRLIYGLVLSIKNNDFVLASKLISQPNWKIILKHILPNCFPSLIVLFTMNLGTSMMLEAAMSYLGIGIKPPTATWGGMVSDSYSALVRYPMLAILPGLCILLVVVSFNIVGDGLRDALDPRLRGKLS